MRARLTYSTSRSFGNTSAGNCGLAGWGGVVVMAPLEEKVTAKMGSHFEIIDHYQLEWNIVIIAAGR
jgi:hypothetical protein